MKILNGNIFTTNCQTIVNTVNCVGIMGAGMALECKYRYPEMFVRYKEMCDQKQLDIGKLYLYKTHEKWILNFPTKYHWKYDTKREFIEKGLKKFVDCYKDKGIESIAFPLLGSQNGGLSKDESILLLEKHLSILSIPVEIYQYDPNSKDDLFDNFKLAFLTHDEPTLIKLTQLNESKISKIKDLLKNENLSNMSQIISFDGIGESTIAKCFSYAMRSDTLNIQLNIF
jgi:O-acetyl-ADP-ribose deacetylase (regulator of RNase III)